jgi:peptidoglycan/xylan/chitin deacetylase (PgdA/CDA1 family)
MYHDVVVDPAASGFQGAGPDHYKVAVERFAGHLDAIESCGVRPTLLGEGATGVSVLLTFDDGGSSALTHTAPQLERHGWRGHFFVTTDRIGTAGFLDRDGLRALDDAGHVVGSHACSHRALTRLSDDEVRREWSESKNVLEEILGKPVTTASVPTGRYSARVGRAAAHAGYRHLFTCEPWLEPRPLAAALVYGRFAVYSGTSPKRVRALCSLSRPTVWWMSGAWYARKAAKTVLGPLYDPVRARVLARVGMLLLASSIGVRIVSAGPPA